MGYIFTETESAKIIGRFGLVFHEKVKGDIGFCCEKWKLEILSLVDYFSVNCIFFCRSEIFGDAVLKIGRPGAEVRTEVAMLEEYDGGRFCRIYDHDLDNGAILEERLMPGSRLREVRSLEKRLSVFADVYNGLHIAPKDIKAYPSYAQWVGRITQYMSKMTDHMELYLLMKKAQGICGSLCKEYNKSMLLHGDLHHDNILLSANGAYKIIDPKGVVGDPVFDIPRFILNEFYGEDKVLYDEYRLRVSTMVDFFEKNLRVPKDVMRQCLFVETVMANCWSVESNEPADMNEVRCAEALMEGD